MMFALSALAFNAGCYDHVFVNISSTCVQQSLFVSGIMIVTSVLALCNTAGFNIV